MVGRASRPTVSARMPETYAFPQSTFFHCQKIDAKLKMGTAIQLKLQHVVMSLRSMPSLRSFDGRDGRPTNVLGFPAFHF